MIDTTAAADLPTRPKDDDVVGHASFNRSFQDFTGVVPDGVVAVTLKDIETFTGPNKFKPGETRTQVVWKFSVDGQASAGCLAYFTSFSMHEKSKLPGLCVALGRQGPTEKNPGLSKSAFVGAKARALVENLPSTKDPTQMFLKITKLLKA